MIQNLDHILGILWDGILAFLFGGPFVFGLWLQGLRPYLDIVLRFG